MFWSPITCLGASVLLAGGVGPAPVELHVAPAGADTNAGTAASPFATLHRARDELRARRAAGRLTGAATVIAHAGTYPFAEPLVFGPADSGSQDAPVVYTTAPGERVVLSGGVAVEGWEPFGTAGRIYRADLSAVDLGEARFWQLFYRGRRQVLARSPNFDPEHPRSGGFRYAGAVVEEGSKTLLRYKPGDLDPRRWSNPSELRVHVWPWLNWNRDILPIRAVDTKNRVLTLARPARYKFIEGNRFFVENALEELDAPGEWYYDPRTKQLYFWPPDQSNPGNQVTIPRLDALIRLQGDPATGAFVSHIKLAGLTLAETHGGLVSINMAAGCEVVGCILTRCGGTALSLSERSHHNQIRGCDIHHVGGSAIVLDGVRDWTPSLAGRISDNLITNNHVHDVGEGGNAWGAIMINPGCGGNVTHDNVISHNLVHDTPRQGITFNGFRNIVEYNRVHHTNQEQSDTGAIGMGSRDIEERGSIVRYNYVHDTGGYCMLKPGVWDYPHYCWGIYLDDYTSGVLVCGNLVVRAQRGGVMVHGGQDNVIENNIIVDSLSQQIEYAPIDSHTSGRTAGNPNQAVWLMTGTKLLGNIFYYTAAKAGWVRGRKWNQILAVSDRNVIWHVGGRPTVNLPDTNAADSWAAWLALGHDTHSIIADPLFSDPAHDDYHLRPDSPALALGFKPLPLDQIGLYESPDRATWPVAAEVWREEHLLYPEGPPPAPRPPAPRAEVPRAKVVRLERPPSIDGRVDAPEWPWAAAGAKLTIAALSLAAGVGTQSSDALVGYDTEALYVALVNRVSEATELVSEGGTWGRDDGAEICLQAITAGQAGPRYVVQGYPSGKCESVTHAGAPVDAAQRLGEAVAYAATIGEGQWTGEWRIPWSAVGIDPAQRPRILFNIGVLKAAEREWISWVSTGGAPWHLERAGELALE